MDVAAQPGPLAADDERGLRVRLEPDQAVDDVGAGALELARPDDVRLLVEAGLDLDEDDDLLAALGGPDERLDDRRVARRPVQRLLDREDVGSSAAWVMNRSTDAANDSYGWWTRMSPARIAANMSAGSSSSGGRSRGGVTGVHGGALEVRPVEVGDLAAARSGRASR